MKPIVEQNWADVDVVRYVLGSMDNHRTEDAASVLSTVMGMIPGGAVEISIEGISKGLARGDRALLHRRNTVKPRRSFLQNTMPMDRGAFFRAGDIVGDSDLECISPISFDGRAREGTVDQEHAFVDAIGCKVSSSDLEVIGSDDTSHRWVFIGIGVGRGVSAPREACWKWIVGQKSREGRSRQCSQNGLTISGGLRKGRNQGTQFEDRRNYSTSHPVGWPRGGLEQSSTGRRVVTECAHLVGVDELGTIPSVSSKNVYAVWLSLIEWVKESASAVEAGVIE